MRSHTLSVNGQRRVIEFEACATLLEVLRDQLKLWSVREACGVGACGACTVLLNGKPISSCLFLAARAEGQELTTLEGLSQGEKLHPIQEAFIERRAFQCGYCTPGFILAVKALLDENPDPSDEEVRSYLSGNLCRCGAYTDILEAVRLSAEKRSV